MGTELSPDNQHGEIARLVRDSFAAVSGRQDALALDFYAELFAIAPETRELFPINMITQRSRLLGALVNIIQLVDRPAELEPFLRQLGRDHRKFDVVAGHYDAVGAALVAALRRASGPGWTPAIEHAWHTAYGIIATAMREAAANETGPAWWKGMVVEHNKLTQDLAVLRVQPEGTLPYRPGNHVSVEIPQRPRLWRYLSPANAPRGDGQLEFHVRAVDGGWVSRAIVQHARPGDIWRIGPALGNLGFEREQELGGHKVLLVAGGTGFAPMCSILGDLERRAMRPTVHLVFGGRSSDELYGLPALLELAAATPWLTVTPVTEDGSVPGGVTGTLADAVSRPGRWDGYDIMVAGSPGMVLTTVAGLRSAGVPAERIHYDAVPA